MDVIYLNGASSSGKTSLAKALQTLLPGYYLHIGIDRFIGMMPDKANSLSGAGPADGFYWTPVTLPNEESAFRIQSGEYGRQVNEAYRKTVGLLLDQGLNVIVDDVADGQQEVSLWRRVLNPHASWFVGVHCSLDTLRQRESARGDRMEHTAIEQFHRVHQGVAYDFEVDTSRCSVEQCAQSIADSISSQT